MIFEAGTTVIKRDLFDGKVFVAGPHRVLHDTGGELLLAYWPGITSLQPRSWIEWLRTGDESLRDRLAVELAERSWQLDEFVWQRNGRLSWFGVDEWFSLHRYYHPDGSAQGWYVNFERPLTRSEQGIETFDVAIDLVTEPDLSSWRWKDEDEYAQLQEQGVLDKAEVREIEAARERAVKLVESRGGPIGKGWNHWLPDPAWPLPVLSEA